jgi:hypothetical protein
MVGPEAAQIHYDDVRFGHQRCDGHTPHLAAAEQFGNPEPPVRVTRLVHLD